MKGFGVAVCCAERGLRAHLLLRGEQLKVPTGYNLISLMYGNVRYVSRTEYSRREEMLIKHAELVAGDGGNVVWMDDILQEDFGGLNLEKGSVPLDGSRDSHLKDENKMSSRKVVIVNEGAGNLVGLLGRFVSSYGTNKIMIGHVCVYSYACQCICSLLYVALLTYLFTA